MTNFPPARPALTFLKGTVLRYLLCVFALLVGTPLEAASTASDAMEVINLRHRPAEEIIPLIEPLIGADGAVTGRDSQLLVRTSAAKLAQIKAMMNQLDRRPAQLVITVEHGSHHVLTRRGEALAEKAEARVHSTERQDEDTRRHSVRVTEGHEAFIATGQDVPSAASASDVVHGSGVASPGSVAYRSVRSGFLVLPRIHGDTVTLTLTPQWMEPQPNRAGVIDIEAASTVVSGKLGEWIEFGVVEHSEQVSHEAILRSTARERGAVKRLRFQVTQIDP